MVSIIFLSVQIIGCYFKVHAVQFYYILITYPEGLPKVKNFLMVAVLCSTMMMGAVGTCVNLKRSMLLFRHDLIVV